MGNVAFSESEQKKVDEFLHNCSNASQFSVKSYTTTKQEDDNKGVDEQELQQTINMQSNNIKQQVNTIEQLQIRIQELDIATKQQDEVIRQHVTKLDQYKNSDENNLKAIEQLEANIWQATDEKQQLVLTNANFETQIQDMMSEMDKLTVQVQELDKLKNEMAETKSGLTNKDSECEQLKAQLQQATSHNTCEAELARQCEQLQRTQANLEKLSNDYQNIMAELEATRQQKQYFEEQVYSIQNANNQKTNIQNAEQGNMIATAPVQISQHIEPSEHHYQSPPPAVFDWNAVAEVKEENVANFFTTPQIQDQSATSFFEDIGAPPAIPQVDSFFEGIDTQQPTAPSHPAPTYQQEPQPNSPHSNSYNELRNLQDQLRMKVVQSEQLSVGLNDLKSQWEDKQCEAENLQQALTKLQEEKFEEMSQSQEAFKNMNSLSAENESLRQQVLSLTDSMSDCNQTISDLQIQLERIKGETQENATLYTTEKEIFTQQTKQEEIPAAVSQEISTTASLFTHEETAANLFQEDQAPTTSSLFQEDQTQTTASLFGQENEQSTAALFSQVQTPSTATMFGEEQTSTTSSLFSQEQPQIPNESILTPLTELKQDELHANLMWYQSELSQYQQACTDWQVWGEAKTQEINELNENLNCQTEAVRIKKAENEKLLKQIQEKEESSKKNEAQNMRKIKELEVLDLKETVERLESEKEELTEEINETRNTIDELRTINDNVECYRDDSALLVDTKNNLDEAEKERTKLSSDLTELRNEMATIQFSNDKTIKDLRIEMEEKNQEINDCNLKLQQSSEKINNLEKSLTEEKKMQEEIGDEYEGMQIQVQESTVRISELLKEIENLKKESEAQSDEKEKLKVEIESIGVADKISRVSEHRIVSKLWGR